MRDLLVLEDSTIGSMLKSAQYRMVLPCLENAFKQSKSLTVGCGTCRKQVRQDQRGILRQAKECIKNANAGQVNELKRLLKTKRYRLVETTNGRTVKTTF